MTDIFLVPEPLLQAVGSVPFEPRQIQVVKYGEHCRAMCELERRVDRAYTQRNTAAVALVRMALLLGWPAGRGLDDRADSAPEWRHVVYLDLPNGEQVSYHMAPADVHLLEGLPEYAGKWDGKFTGTTAWAEMVPPPGWVTDMAYRPEELGDPGSEPCLDLSPANEADFQAFVNATGFPGLQHSGSETARIVPKAPFKPGVCACPKCEQPRAAGKLFCALHRSGASREASGNLGGPRALISSLIPRDGEQQ